MSEVSITPTHHREGGPSLQTKLYAYIRKEKTEYGEIRSVCLGLGPDTIRLHPVTQDQVRELANSLAEVAEKLSETH